MSVRARVGLVIKHHFDSAHHLPNYEGKCKKVHGHRWDVEIHIVGSVNPKTGMVVDFKLVKDLIDKYDHQDLNNHFENPTAEIIALKLKSELKLLPGINVIRLKLWESLDCYVEV